MFFFTWFLAGLLLERKYLLTCFCSELWSCTKLKSTSSVQMPDLSQETWRCFNVSEIFMFWYSKGKYNYASLFVQSVVWVCCCLFRLRDFSQVCETCQQFGHWQRPLLCLTRVWVFGILWVQRFDAVIEALEKGQAVDLSGLPPSPGQGKEF